MPSTIKPFLWFDKDAVDAAHYYVKLFGGEVLETHSNSSGEPLTATFKLRDTVFVALNGGPHFKFTPAVSFAVDCDSQDEIDRYWDTLLADGGSESQCGWISDKWGLSWQIVPAIMPQLIGGPDGEAAGRAFKKMMTMKKLNIAELQAARRGE